MTRAQSIRASLRYEADRACGLTSATTDASKVTMKTRGEIEASICQGMIRFELEHMGRGPKDIRAHT